MSIKKWLRELLGTDQIVPPSAEQKKKGSSLSDIDAYGVNMPVRPGVFTTENAAAPKTRAEEILRIGKALQFAFQKIEAIVPVDEKGNKLEITHAMDEVYQDLTTAKIVNNARGFVPVPQLDWYSTQGFIGWQLCAVLSQNWLIDKACTVPANDAVRHGYDISISDGSKVDPKILDHMRRLDKQFKIKRHCRSFVKKGRIFGIRHALFLVDGIDYEAPFNPDGVKPGTYKGIIQIDPYWMAPQLNNAAAANPASSEFYEPTWWCINGKRIHRSHFVIMRNGDEVVDILKPAYLYGGIPIPQKVFERVYAAERTANEAPMLAMTKRLTALKLDLTSAAAEPEKVNERMAFWTQLQNNFGVKIIGDADEIQQFDTSLTSFDETIMTQYQLVAAAANIPATKLLGTTPKGFNASGDYEADSYHEELESIQENDLTALVERHHLLLIRSEIAPKNGIEPFSTEVVWKPVDSPTAKEQAEINSARATTDKAWVDAGAIDGTDVRQRLISDPDSGYNGIAPIVPGGPGDRDAEQTDDDEGAEPGKGEGKSDGE